MRTTRLLRPIAVSLITAGPVGGFFLGLMNAGDPDPNPIGRVVHAFMMAGLTPLHGGFPPRGAAESGQSYNGWPHMVLASLLIFGWLIYRDRARSTQSP